MIDVPVKEGVSIFLDCLVFPLDHDKQPSSDVDCSLQHQRYNYNQRPSTKAIECSRMLLSVTTASISNKRKLRNSPIGGWITFSSNQLCSDDNNDDYDSDVSDWEETDNDMAAMRESRWCSSSCLTHTFSDPKTLLLKKSTYTDTAMILPSRQQSYCNLNTLDC